MSVVILRGDAASLPLPDESVDLLLTSPPYWSLRDYRDGGKSLAGQIGNEKTWQEYVANLLTCTREWMRVLKPSGSMFVVLGDKYSDRGHGPNRGGGTGRGPQQAVLRQTRGALEKSLLMLPERYRIACVDELGLTARAVVEWAKPNPMPESVNDRVRRGHEDIVHLVRSPRYFSAVDEIREAHTMKPQRRPGGRPEDRIPRLGQPRQAWPTAQRDEIGVDGHPLGKLPGSVWEIATVPLHVPEWLEHADCCGGRKREGCEDGLDHHAAMPPELARRIILGWSPAGICLECGEGRRPVAGMAALDMTRPRARRAHQLAERAGLTEAHLSALLSVGVSDTGRGAATQNGTGKNTPEVYALAGEARAALGGYAREYLIRRPTVLSYACACPDTSAPTRPAVVADPCGGTGTTAMTASVLGRTGVTVDRSFGYCRLARWRTSDPAERARALGVPKPPPVPDGQLSIFDQEEAG